MMPEEVAMKFASASATCRNTRCPYASDCKGTLETCKIREVGLIIRTLLEEEEKLRHENDLLTGAMKLIAKYCNELEKINRAYYKIIMRYQAGHSTTYKPKKRAPYIGSGRGRGRKKKSLIEMDGDERYAMPEEPKPPKDPVVII